MILAARGISVIRATKRNKKGTCIREGLKTLIKCVMSATSMILITMVKSVKKRNLRNMVHEGNISYE